MISDKDLGMKCPISRRDFIAGTAVAIGAIGTPGVAAAAVGAGSDATDYPPAKTGLRGSHPGSFEPAHMLRDKQLSLSDVSETGETYDCVIVGGGMSGLAAATYFRKYAGPSAKILILENHDDFGGHAKRNEFTVDGKLLVLNGGTQNMEAPMTTYNLRAREVLEDIGVDVARYEQSNASEKALYRNLGLERSYFFDKETWGNDRLVRTSAPGGRGSGGFSPEFIQQAPLSAKARADLLRLLDPVQPDYLPGMSATEKKHFLATVSLQDYYLKTVGVDPQVLWFYKRFGEGSFCVGADANPALFAWVQGLPGFSGLGLGEVPGGLLVDLPGAQHGRQNEKGKARSIHFPDGNATLARLMVSKLIPGSIPAKTQEEMGTARVDYGKLDQPGQAARIRLSSIVVNVRHDGDPATATEAVVTYVNGGRLQSVRGRAVIMACWNGVIPHLIPELPQKQREALSYGTKAPLVYTSVAIRNWRSFEKLKVSSIQAPTMFQPSVELAEAVSLGDLKHPTSPDQPIALHLTKAMSVPGLPKRDQHRAGRAQLLAMSFEHFERETRKQLARMLGEGGFDPARDIAGITVNRWPHGYAYTYNSLYDPVEWVFSETPDRPCVVGRQPYGLITIANSDAAASPHTDAAFQEAHRATSEALEMQTYPFARRV